MEPLSGAASVIAVIQISQAVASLCFQYLRNVKNAKSDIERLQGELGRLNVVLEGAQKLLDGPNGARLRTSQGLRDGLTGCSLQLEGLKTKLEKKLNTGKTGKIMSLCGSRALKWPFESKDVDGIICTIERYRDTLSAGLSIDQGALLLDHIERVDDDERLKILKWISPVQYGKHHATVKEVRTSDTCEWLLRHERFREWEDSNSSMILWLQGSPGTGKTFLTSKVIDHIQSQLEAFNQEGFAFFYCNRNEKDRREPLSVLRSYVRQLSTTTRNPEDMRKKLRDLWRKTDLKGSDLRSDTCREQLLESVNLYSKTTLVLDALDECELDSDDHLVDTIEFLLSKSERPLKIFISSRPNWDIRRRFLSRPNIEIQATKNQEDIEKFVNAEIDKPRKCGPITESLRGEIVKTLLDRSQGMFQWANLQIKQLLALPIEADIKDNLGRLPDDLNAAYKEIYDKAAQKKHAKALIDRACMWVMCACTPLTTVELISAIRLDPNSDVMSLSDEVKEDVLLELCNNLLVLDSQRKVWRFSHLSVAEYFEENHWDLRQAHCHVAKACILLLIETYKNSRLEAASKSSDNAHGAGVFDLAHPLQQYSRHHWIIHVQTQEGNETDSGLTRILQMFLGSPEESSLQYRAWYRQIVSDDFDNMPLTSAFSDIYERQIAPEHVSIFIMCRFSFYTVLLDWWNNAEIGLSQTTSRGDNLLALAAAAGCKPICENLIKRGIQVNMQFQSIGYGSALGVAAAADGGIEIVKFLVQEAGANVNMMLQTGEYGSALAAAAVFGRTETVKFLIQEVGAEVNMPLQGGRYGSALAAAAAVVYGRTETVKFLVQEAGAEVNMPLQGGRYGSALAAAAAAFGRTETVKFLVQEAGAEVNIPLQTGEYGSALAAAAAFGRTETVKFLIQEVGAEVNMPLQGGRYGSALIAAAYFGEIGTIRFLVRQGAEVNMLPQSGRYGNTLSAAAYCGWKGCAEILIEAGAKVNLRLEAGPFRTALQAATADISEEDQRRLWNRRDEESFRQDKAKVAELLLRHGATSDV